MFAALALLRRGLYKSGIFKSQRVAKPVIVVGNITVGGTGKTPFVIWLTQQLCERGLHPAIITRGYGGRASQWPQVVTEQSDPHEVGDEAVLLAQRTQAMVVAGPDRVADAQRAIELGADVIVCDDGLQHYRLQRDAELVLFDAERGAGNGMYLPAGPLREGMRRLRSVSLVIEHRRGNSGARTLGVEALAVSSELGMARALTTAEQRPLASFTGQPVHALAAIGNPEAFFAALRRAGLNVDARALPDHAPLTAADLAFNDDLPVLMTEKDAVKCRAFADARCWSVELAMSMTTEQSRVIMQVVDAALGARNSFAVNS
jgi:tetraacyldisaccharide 4'-kinase